MCKSLSSRWLGVQVWIYFIGVEVIICLPPTARIAQPHIFHPLTFLFHHTLQALKVVTYRWEFILKIELQGEISTQIAFSRMCLG